MHQLFRYAPAVALALAVLSTLSGDLGAPAHAELFINEIFLDPGGDGEDTRDEYIELRGTPGMSLENHFLILVENENDLVNNGSTGEIENVFILGDDPNTPAVETPYELGSNGFMTIRMKDSLYTDVAPDTFDIVNSGSENGFGSGPTSSIRHYGQNNKVKTENSGFTAMLIRNDGDGFLNQPFLGLDLDVGNDGLDSVEDSQFGWRSAWEIIDAVGLFSEAGEAGVGRLYAPINFGPEIPGQQLDPSDGGKPDGEGNFVFVPNIEDEAVYVGVDFEIELVARWGNSTGQTPEDWHVTNLSDKAIEGRFTASEGVDPNAETPVIDYRQSGGFHDLPDDNPPGPTSRVESNRYVPYGTPLTSTLGAANYPLNVDFLPGDFNGDGLVNLADYTVWRDNLGATGLGLAADADGSGTVDLQDYEWWKANFGTDTGAVAGVRYSNPTLGTLVQGSRVPEPSSLVLVFIAGGLAFRLNRDRG